MRRRRVRAPGLRFAGALEEVHRRWSSWGGATLDGISDYVDFAGDGDHEDPADLLQLPGGGYLIGGGATDGYAFAKLTGTGALDTSWGGGDGQSALLTPPSATSGGPSQLHLLPDGSVVVEGSPQFSDGTNTNFAVGRFGPDGEIDLTYGGGDGVSDILDWANQWDSALDSYLRADGSLLLSGGVSFGGTAETDVAILQLDSVAVPQYGDGGQTWDSGDSTHSMFAVCLAAFSNGADTDGSTWQPDTFGAAGDCDSTDTDPWNAVATGPGQPGSDVAFAPLAGTEAATIELSFGFRTSNHQPIGRYIAPITFEGIAPNV